MDCQWFYNLWNGFWFEHGWKTSMSILYGEQQGIHANKWGKTSFFNCHCCFLPSNHRYRKNINDFFVGRVEKDVASRIFLVKNCMMLCQSTVTLCLVSNQVSRSFLLLVWLVIGWSKVSFGSFLIGRPLFSTITLTSCALKRTCLRTFSTLLWMWRGRQRTTSRLDWM